MCTSNKYHYLQMLRFRGQNGVKTEKCMQLPACTSSAKNVAQPNPFEHHVFLQAFSGGASA